MSQLQAIQLDENTVIYIAANQTIEAPSVNYVTVADDEERPLNSRSVNPQQAAQQAIQNFASLQTTIKSFAEYSLNSFKQIANANVDKVTLKFGVNIGGKMGIPYITEGSVGSNLEITVECSFKQPQPQITP